MGSGAERLAGVHHDVDRVVPPFLGRRRGWLLLMQVVIVLGLVVLATSALIAREQKR